ncbi:hypothetical protein UF75_4897 [Desulfosporosinus sp. I2]|nr:hypothetical protein UF75_4897 [Desulfosporosinus sp. I2]
MAFFLCCVVLLFPWALRTERIIWWILSILFFVIIGTLWPILRINKDKSQNDAICLEQNRSEENIDIQERIAERQKDQDYTGELQEEQMSIAEPQEEQMSIVEPQEEQMSIAEPQEEQMSIVEPQEEQMSIAEPQEEQMSIAEPQEEQVSIVELQEEQVSIVEPQEEQVSIVELHEELVEIDTTLNNTEALALTLLEPFPELNIISLEELIDLGFKAKHSDNFEQAAFYFSKALSLDPVPDIAFYLILDCYWLWNNLDEREYALSQLDGIIKRYLPRFNSELSHQFNVWMTKENIDIN